MLYNFVRLIEGSNADAWLDLEVDKEVEVRQDIQLAVEYPIGLASLKKIDKFRDDIIEKMWAQY